MFVLIAIHLVFFTTFTVIVPSAAARVFIFSVELIIPHIIVLVVFLKEYMKTQISLYIYMFGITVLFIFVNAWRIFIALFGNVYKTSFLDDRLIGLFMLFFSLVQIFKTVLVLLLLAFEYEQDLLVINSDLETLSLTDHLTGIYNKRALTVKLEEEVSRIKRVSGVLTIAVIDLDHFKRVNDQYGHVYGDEVLKEFCTFISDRLRGYDIFGRYGGEEFLVIFPDTTLDQGYHALERMRIELEEFEFSKPDFHITFSGGVYELTGELNEDIRYYIDKADRLLYEAKENGRNQIVYKKNHLNK